MSRLLGRAGDLLLNAVAPKVDAGACVADAGQCCFCFYVMYKYDCWGNCVKTGSKCSLTSDC